MPDGGAVIEAQNSEASKKKKPKKFAMMDFLPF